MTFPTFKHLRCFLVPGIIFETSEMFFLILVVLGIIWVLYKTFKDEFSPLRKIPYASSHVPILGHALVFLRERNHLKVLRDWSEKHGPIFRYNRGFGKLNQLLKFKLIMRHSFVVFNSTARTLELYFLAEKWERGD